MSTILNRKSAAVMFTDIVKATNMMAKDEEKHTEALQIISNYEEILRQPVQDGESWECEECNKVNPDTFEICWSCQTNRMTVT